MATEHRWERPSVSRIILAFLIAPVVPAAIVFLVRGLIAGFSSVVDVTFSVVFYGYFTALVIGVPAYLALRRTSMGALRAYAAIGALVGITGYALILLPDSISTGAIESWQSIYQTLMISPSVLLLAPVFGLVAASVFWSIAVRQGE